MRRFLLSHANSIRIVACVLLVLTGLAGVVYLHSSAGAQPLASLHYNAEHSAPIPDGARDTGHHNGGSQIQIEVVLHPRNESSLLPLIQALSTPGSPQYGQWLAPAQFNAMFPAPAFDSSWLSSHGIRQLPGPSPLVKVFSGTSSQFEAAFHTTIDNYHTRDGRDVYANKSAPEVPSASFAEIAGVIGLDNVTNGQVKPELSKPLQASGKAGLPRYGAGAHDSGLSPAQVQGIYNAPPIYKVTKGQGITTAVFELSGYPGASDIRAYEHAYGLPQATIQNINIDGGSCPAAKSFGLPCNYAAAEDNIDIELQQAMAPGVSKIQVYLGPNTDQGVLDTYMAIANQNTASAISSSWGQCEASLDSGVAHGEYLAFAQMATQGQSISAATGDNGSYDCLGVLAPPTGTGNAVDDPATDPLMTAVGGTSFFGTFDPGSNHYPSYPTGAEYVWDTLNNCSNSDFIVDSVDLSTAFGALCPFSAAGGGNSILWAKGSWQTGLGTNSSASKFGSSCGQKTGVECREVPDISLNGDPNSGYSEYCSDPTCFAFFGDSDVWNQIGGTSTTAPLWSGIVALADAAHHHRIGLPTPALYRLDNSTGYAHALHDMQGGGSFTFDWSSLLSSVTGKSITFTQKVFTSRNGVGNPLGFKETADYDMATGLGTPNVGAMVPLLAP
jgi:subtilase family serine protease